MTFVALCQKVGESFTKIGDQKYFSATGTGIQNLRECIIETKWKYDVASEDKQVAWKALILNFMERYFYLICFATYALEHGPIGYQKSFVSWMDDHKELRTMIGMSHQL